jgi:hypothetical protein
MRGEGKKRGKDADAHPRHELSPGGDIRSIQQVGISIHIINFVPIHPSLLDVIRDSCCLS